jgi:pimeloyl-ACP methyl ester carboxylesterase
MQSQALELQAPYWERLDKAPLVPDIAERLGEVQAPTLVLVGEEDVEDMHALAERFATEIPRARLATIPGAAPCRIWSNPAQAVFRLPAPSAGRGRPWTDGDRLIFTQWRPGTFAP